MGTDEDIELGERLFATVTMFCNNEQGFSAIGSAEGMPRWEDFWEYTFASAVKDYIFLEERPVEKPSNHDFGLNCTRRYDYVDYKEKLYRIPWHNEWRENPRIKALLDKVKASTEALREEFENALRRRMKRPEVLVAGFRDLFDKEKFESFAKKRQGRIVGKEYKDMTHAYRYDDSGHLEDRLTNEERREMGLICSLMGTHTYCYLMSMNIPY